MVAITVILAAVIGTFVLGLGDQVGDTAPQASFTVENIEDAESADGMNIDIRKTGGQDISTSDLAISVAGDRQDYDDAIGDPNPEPTWQTGETAGFEEVGTGLVEGDRGERVTVTLIHTPTGDEIYRTQVTVPDDLTEST